MDILVLPAVSRRARTFAPSRRFLAAAVVAAALLAAGCFPGGSGESLGAHHNDPFLTCTRQRESGGNYRVDSPGGQYHGAYQFLQSTWNLAANHSGRGDLVGLDPRRASAYDQDEMALTLYQWEGKRPWSVDPF